MASIMRVRTIATGVAGAPWYVNTYWSLEGARNASDSANRMRLFWDSLKLGLATGVTYQVDPEVAQIDAFTGEVENIFEVNVAPVAGGAGVPALPFFTQGMVRLNTNGVVRGRRVQGRIYVPGVAQQGTANGQPPPTFVSGMQTAAALLLAAPDNALPVVWSRPFVNTGELPPLFGSSHNVTAVIARTKYGVLRSRRD